MLLSSSSDEDNKRKYSLVEIDCRVCGDLSYKQKGDLGNSCGKCQNIERKKKKERKRKMKEAIAMMEENDKIERQLARYDEITAQYFHKLSKVFDDSSSSTVGEYMKDDWTCVDFQFVRKPIIKKRRLNLTSNFIQKKNEIDEDVNMVPPLPNNNQSKTLVDLVEKKKYTGKRTEEKRDEEDLVQAYGGDIDAHKDFQVCSAIPPRIEQESSSSKTCMKDYVGDTRYVPGQTFNDGKEKVKVEERCVYAHMVEKRKKAIEEDLVAFFGHKEPLKAKNKNYEILCNIEGCQVRTQSLERHLRRSSHKYAPEKASLIRSYKVRIFKYLTIVNHYGVHRPYICKKCHQMFSRCGHHIKVQHKLNGEMYNKYFEECKSFTEFLIYKRIPSFSTKHVTAVSTDGDEGTSVPPQLRDTLQKTEEFTFLSGRRKAPKISQKMEKCFVRIEAMKPQFSDYIQRDDSDILEEGIDDSEVGQQYKLVKKTDFYIRRKLRPWMDRRHLVMLAHILRHSITKGETICSKDLISSIKEGARVHLPFCQDLLQFMYDNGKKIIITDIVKCYRKAFRKVGTASFSIFAGDGLQMCTEVQNTQRNLKELGQYKYRYF